MGLSDKHMLKQNLHHLSKMFTMCDQIFKRREEKSSPNFEFLLLLFHFGQTSNIFDCPFL